MTVLARNHIGIGIAAGVLSALVSAAALAQSAGDLPTSDRRTAVERWEPDPNDIVLFERLRTLPRGMSLQQLGRSAVEGGAAIKDGQLEFHVDTPDSMAALLPAKPVGGPFIAEISFDKDQGASLVLVREKEEPIYKDGKEIKEKKLDLENYTSICVNTDASGKVTVRVHDRQNGQEDVLDSRFAPPPSTQPALAQPATAQATTRPAMDPAYRARFSTTLAGQYSVPVKKTDGKLRIFRDFASGMIRFYYEIQQDIAGEPCTGFLELQPSPEWAGYKGSYYVGPAVRTQDSPATVRFSDWRIFRAPRVDRDDRPTGFKVTRRDYTFSGQSAEGLVVSLGREFAFRDVDRKLVFWSAANYIPFWHLDQQLGLMYEFIETWGEPKDGCFEPMSDRLLRFSHVSVTRDNAVRKRIQWNYTLVNPDYKPWGQDGGAKQLPEVEETWTIYPDGTVLREQKYYPATDGTTPLKWNQVAEIDPIFGARSTPADWLAEEAVTVTGLSGKETKLRWPGRDGDFTDPAKKEAAAFVTVRFKRPSMPDAFLAYAQDPRLSATAPLDLSSSWHREKWWMFSHFPANYQPYQTPANSQVSLPGQITHGGLICLGATRSADWTRDFQVDRDGRKYRRWITLLGLEKQGNTTATAQRVACWLYGANIGDVRRCRYVGYDPQTMEHTVWADSGRGECSFVISPAKAAETVVRPLIRVEGWGQRIPEVLATGIPLRQGQDMAAAVEGGELILWLNREFTGPTRITLKLPAESREKAVEP